MLIFTDLMYFSSIIIENTQAQYFDNLVRIYIKMKHSCSFHISAQNIDCRYSLEPPRQCGPNEYPQSMFLSRNKLYTPVNPSFTE